MKKLRRILAFAAIASVLVCAQLIFSSCSQDTTTPTPPEDDGTETYTVTVRDYLGEVPEDYLVVEIYSGEKREAMKNVDKDGKATFELEDADYGIQIKSVDKELYYDVASAVFDDDNTARITVYNVADSDSAHTIYVPDEAAGGIDYQALSIGEGATRVTIDRPERSYYIFKPERGGKYEISVISDSEMTVGYYGGLHFVMENNLGAPTEQGILLEVPESAVSTGIGGSAQYVIGVDSATAEEGCVIAITRVSDAEAVIPFIDVLPDSGLTKYDNLLNHTLVDLDITDSSVSAVYNESDGYYHYGSQDGPVILVKISAEGNSNVPSLILPSFVTICESDRMGKVFYDDDGNIVRKESYNVLIDAYAELCGSRGVRPLDKKMADAIKNTGDRNGWWTADSEETSIFGADYANVCPDIAWLFACCYEVENTSGGEEKPILLAPTSEQEEFTARADADAQLFFKAIGGAELKITEAHNVTLLIDGEEYRADADGVISARIEKNATFTVISQSTQILRFTFVKSA